MSNRASAARYAKALFDVAVKESDPEQVERDLTAFVDVVNHSDELQRVLGNPAVPAVNKQGVVAAVTTRLGVPPSSPVAKLMLLLAQRDRFDLIADLADSYRQRLMDHLKIVRAEIVTAIALADGDAAKLEARLSQLAGRTVAMHRRVDATIVGGLVARVGGIVYDGSVSTQLSRMRTRLIEEA